MFSIRANPGTGRTSFLRYRAFTLPLRSRPSSTARFPPFSPIAPMARISPGFFRRSHKLSFFSDANSNAFDPFPLLPDSRTPLSGATGLSLKFTIVTPRRSSPGLSNLAVFFFWRKGFFFAIASTTGLFFMNCRPFPLDRGCRFFSNALPHRIFLHRR